MTDKKLIEQIIIGCKRGDDDCFAQFVDLYSSRLYNYFYRLSGNSDTAGDLLGTLFLKLVEKIGTYSGQNFNGWIFKIASNLFYDHLRALKKQKKLLENVSAELSENYQSLNNGPKPDDSQKDLSAALQKNLQKLEPAEAELILMRYYSDMSFAELAQLRKEPIGTTLSKVHRSIKKLRDLMESEK
ncbi:MAG: RNA polymerase sigma factor [Anaerohalosphaeraceae bacterium]|nr:RNA polymerase sigma factor [Anaerohalosphaeraceae bacterium]